MSGEMIGGATAGATGGVVGAVIGAVIGAAVGGVSYVFDMRNYRSALSDQIEETKKARDNYLQLLDNKYKIDKVNALNSAELKDSQGDYAEKLLNGQTQSQLSELIEQDRQRVFAFNQQNAQIEKQTGAALATQAASGTRVGSTVSQAIEFEDKTQNNLLEQAENNARIQSDMSLKRVAYSFLEQQQQIQSLRTDAYNNRAIYAQAGDSYKGDLKYRATGTAYSAYSIQRAYDEQQYNNQIQKLKDERRKHNFEGGFWNKANYIGGMFKSMVSGSTSGMSTGQSIGTTSGYLWTGLNGEKLRSIYANGTV